MNREHPHAAVDLVADRRKELFAHLRHATAQHDERGVEDRNNVGDTDAKIDRSPFDCAEDCVILALCHELWRYPVEIVSSEFEEAGGLPHFNEADGFCGEGRGAAKGFQATEGAATT